MGVVVDTSALVAAERRATPYAKLMVGVLLADTPTRAAVRRAKIETRTVRVPVMDFGPAIAEEWAPGTWASACWWGRPTKHTSAESPAST